MVLGSRQRRAGFLTTTQGMSEWLRYVFQHPVLEGGSETIIGAVLPQYTADGYGTLDTSKHSLPDVVSPHGEGLITLAFGLASATQQFRVGCYSIPQDWARCYWSFHSLWKQFNVGSISRTKCRHWVQHGKKLGPRFVTETMGLPPSHLRNSTQYTSDQLKLDTLRTISFQSASTHARVALLSRWSSSSATLVDGKQGHLFQLQCCRHC